MVRMLLQRGASINLQDYLGVTALMGAALYGRTTIVQALLDAKANALLRSVDGCTALMLLPSQAASGPQEQARAAEAAQKAAADVEAAAAAAVEWAQAEATAAKRAAVERAAEERALAEAIAQSVSSHAAEEQRRAAVQAATPSPAAAPPLLTSPPSPTPPLPPPSPSPPPAGPLVLTYLELQTATNNFAQAVGTGGFASVYRTEGALPSLPHHGPCAVKRLTADVDTDLGGHGGGGRDGERGAGRGGGRAGRGCSGVAREVALLGRCTPHASLLPLLGYCLEASRLPCLVYPLCEGGTLEDRLLLTSAGFDRLAALGWAAPPAPLAWPHRLTILRDAACALAHLHAQQPVLLHGDVAAPSEGVAVITDKMGWPAAGRAPPEAQAPPPPPHQCAYSLQIKPSNILLDARGEARLADFGLARVAKQRAGTDATVASVSAVCGTAAFLDPI